MKNQALFSSKDKSKKIKCCLLQFLFGALWVKCKHCRAYSDAVGFQHRIYVCPELSVSFYLAINAP